MAIVYYKTGTVAVGRISKITPLKHVGANNTAVIEFSIACRNGNLDKEKDTTFIDCQAWADMAHEIEPFQKGELVKAYGTTQIQSWNDKISGEPKTKTLLTVEWIEGKVKPPTRKNTNYNESSPTNTSFDEDEDAPF